MILCNPVKPQLSESLELLRDKTGHGRQLDVGILFELELIGLFLHSTQQQQKSSVYIYKFQVLS